MVSAERSVQMKNALLLIVLVAAGLSAKRAAPSDIAPVHYRGVIFRVVHWEADNFIQNGGYIEAVDSATGKLLWGKLVYALKYDSKLERDVQDVFIKEMAIDTVQKKLKIKDERNKSYIVNVPDFMVKGSKDLSILGSQTAQRIWALKSISYDTLKWVIIREKDSTMKDLYHVEVVSRLAKDPKYQIKRLCPHCAVTSDALVRSIDYPMKSGDVYPEQYDSERAKWNAKDSASICRTAILKCLQGDNKIKGRF